MREITNNMRGAIFMSLAVLGYILNDTTIKYFAAELPIFQTIFIRGCLVSVLIGTLCLKSKVFKKE